MRNLWLMAKHEYSRLLRRRTFLLSTLGMPLLIIGVVALGIFTAIAGSSNRPLGYVDHAGVLETAVMPPGDDDMIEIRAFAGEAAAQTALEQREIQAYYVLPPDYLQSQRLSLYYWDDAPGDELQGDFNDFVRANLVTDLPQETRQRLVEGVTVTRRSIDGSREIGRNNIANFILPLVASFFFAFSVIIGAGYLLQVVTDEKENRTIEMMVTSMSPEQLIGGKALGLMGVSLTQVLIWSLTIVVGLIVGAQYLDFLRNIQVPWLFLLITVVFFVPTYALIAGIMTAIGGIVTELRQGQQIAGMINLFFMFPFFLIGPLIADPNSLLAVGLSLLPTSAFITILVRWSAGIVPLWQLLASWGLLLATAVFSVWVSARIFRAGMLRYGQRLDLSAVWTAVRGKVRTS